jgi:hypothetical protein
VEGVDVGDHRVTSRCSTLRRTVAKFGSWCFAASPFASSVRDAAVGLVVRGQGAAARKTSCWKVSVLAQTGLSFDLSTVSGKLMRTIMAGPAEFERDLIRDRAKSGLAAARAMGVNLGRPPGQRPLDKKAKRVLGIHADELSYRLIARNVGMSKNTVMDIVRWSVGR